MLLHLHSVPGSLSGLVLPGPQVADVAREEAAAQGGLSQLADEQVRHLPHSHLSPFEAFNDLREAKALRIHSKEFRRRFQVWRRSWPEILAT